MSLPLHLDPRIRLLPIIQRLRPDDRSLPDCHRRAIIDRVHQVFLLEIPLAPPDFFVGLMMLDHHLVTLLVLIRIAHVLIVSLPVPLDNSLLAVALVDTGREA